MQKCILIVEDNELTMQLFNDLLEAHGYKPLPSRSGVEVLETACTNSVLDIQLPDVPDFRSRKEANICVIFR